MRRGEIDGANVAAAGRGWERLSWRPEFKWDYLRETVEWYRDRPLVDVSGTR
jgi:hypothetical protein